MPRKPKKPADMTSEELAKKVFPPKVLKGLKKIANPPDHPLRKKGSN